MEKIIKPGQVLAISEHWSLQEINSKYYLFNSQKGNSYNLTRDLFTFLKRCYGSSPIIDLQQVVKPECLKKLTTILEQLVVEGAITVKENRLLNARPVKVLTYTGSQLKDLIIHITGKCTSNCKHCYVKEQEASPDLPTNALLGVIRGGAKMGVMRVHLTGGEPFLRDDIDRIVTQLQESCICLSSIYTDGSILYKSSSILEMIASNYSPIFNISVDGLEESHDLFRESPGSYKGAIKGLKILQEYGFTIIVNTSLNQFNMNEMLFLFDILQDFPIVRWRVIQSAQLGTWKRNADKMRVPLVQEWKIYNSVIKKWAENGRPFDIDLGHFFHSVNGSFRQPFHNLESYACCEVYQSACTVWPNGDISPCGMLYNGHVVGNIMQTTLQKIWESNMMRYYKNIKIRDIITKKCQKCQYLPICGLGCRGNSCLRGLNFEDPDPDFCNQFTREHYCQFRGWVNNNSEMQTKKEAFSINKKEHYLYNQEWLPISHLNMATLENKIKEDNSSQILEAYKLVNIRSKKKYLKKNIKSIEGDLKSFSGIFLP